MFYKKELSHALPFRVHDDFMTHEKKIYETTSFFQSISLEISVPSITFF